MAVKKKPSLLVQSYSQDDLKLLIHLLLLLLPPLPFRGNEFFLPGYLPIKSQQCSSSASANKTTALYEVLFEKQHFYIFYFIFLSRMPTAIESECL